MIRLRRLAALLMGLLFLQMTLAGEGLMCRAHDHGGGAHGCISGRNAAHPTMGGATANPSSTQGGRAILSTPGSEQCDLAALMGGCASMPSCAPVALNSPGSECAIAMMHAVSPPASYNVAPPSRTTAPEPPPPRA